MDNPAPSPIEEPPSRASFDDPALESAFGLDHDTAWIEHARQSEQPPPSPGRLGQYELLDEIGRGGQGVVYKAIQPGTGRVIAIKCFPPAATLKPNKRDRFTQEVEALIRLHHPSIVTVHGAEVINGSPALLMEFVEGSPIDRWSDAASPARRPREEILGAFTHVCDAVSHAHQRGVIHRDLKPSNVVVDKAGLPRILDFGIARLIGDLQPAGATITGFAGTPSYASPEQLEASSEADTRSDIYSLGVLLYRILTGVEPFAKSLSLPAMLTAIRSGAVRRPSAADPTSPRELDWVILKAMHTDPAQRYQTVDAFAADIDRYLRGEPVTAHPPSTLYAFVKFLRRHAVMSTAALAAILVILSLTGFAVIQSFRLARQNSNLTQAISRESQARKEADSERSRADARAAAHIQMTQAMGNMVVNVVDRSLEVPSLTAQELFKLMVGELLQLAEPEGAAPQVQFYTLRARIARAARQAGRSIPDWTKAIDIAQGLYPPDHAIWAELRIGRADAYFRNRQYREAQAEAALLFDAPDPLHRYEARRLYCSTQASLGDWSGGRRTAAELLAESHPGHPFRADALETMARFFLQEGNFTEGRRYLEESIAELRAINRVKTLSAARVYGLLARTCMELNDPQAAERAARESALTYLKDCGPKHVRTQGAMLMHAESLSHLGRFTEAVQCLEQIHSRYITVYGARSERLARFRLQLAAAYLGADSSAVARRTLALAISRGATDDPDHDSVRNTIQSCIQAISASRFIADVQLAEPLGELSWLVTPRPDLIEFPPRDLSAIEIPAAGAISSERLSDSPIDSPIEPIEPIHGAP